MNFGCLLTKKTKEKEFWVPVSTYQFSQYIDKDDPLLFSSQTKSNRVLSPNQLGLENMILFSALSSVNGIHDIQRT